MMILEWKFSLIYISNNTIYLTFGDIMGIMHVKQADKSQDAVLLSSDVKRIFFSQMIEWEK